MEQPGGPGGRMASASEIRFNGCTLRLHALGRRMESDAALQELQRIARGGRAYLIAEAHAFRGEADHAFAWLDEAASGAEACGSNRCWPPEWLASLPLLKSPHRDARWAPWVPAWARARRADAFRGRDRRRHSMTPVTPRRSARSSGWVVSRVARGDRRTLRPGGARGPRCGLRRRDGALVVPCAHARDPRVPARRVRPRERRVRRGGAMAAVAAARLRGRRGRGRRHGVVQLHLGRRRGDRRRDGARAPRRPMGAARQARAPRSLSPSRPRPGSRSAPSRAPARPPRRATTRARVRRCRCDVAARERATLGSTSDVTAKASTPGANSHTGKSRCRPANTSPRST